MSTAFDAVIQPKETAKVEEQHGAEQKEREAQSQEEKKIVREKDARLRELVQNDDKMYEAMENFLLGNPEDQVSALGEPTSLLAKADEERGKGNNLVARADCETAAKIAIYNQDKEGARKSLDLASQVTDNTKDEDKHSEMQRTILDNLDEVLRIAREYYESVPKASS